MNIHQFLSRSIETLTPTFEVGDGDYDDSVIPANVIASACRKINAALQEKKRVFLGKTTVQDAARQFNIVVEALQDPSYNLDNKGLPLEAFPDKWEPSNKRKRSRKNEDEDEEEEKEVDEEEKEDEEEAEEEEEERENEEESESANEDNEETQLKKQYEQYLRKARKLEADIVKMNKKLQQYKEVTNITDKIKLEEIENKSILSKDSELAEELKQTDDIAARINKKLAKHPAVLAKLKKQKKEIENAPIEDTTSNQIALNLHKQQKERKGKGKKHRGTTSK